MKSIIKKQEYRLLNISFQAIDSQEEKFDLNIKSSDTYRVISVSTDQIELNVSRHISFDPKVFYTLQIDMGIRLSLAHDENGFEYSDDFIKEKIEEIVNDTHACEWISLLIAQISSTLGYMPIITPAKFLTNPK